MQVEASPWKSKKFKPGSMEVLRELSSSFQEISQRSGSAVVQIFVRSFVTGEGAQSQGDVLAAQNSTGSGTF